MEQTKYSIKAAELNVNTLFNIISVYDVDLIQNTYLKYLQFKILNG